MDEQEKRFYKNRFILEVSGLNPDNVKEVFERNFESFQYIQSSEVTVNGEQVKQGLDRFLELLPNEKNGVVQKKIAEKNDISTGGFPLTKKRFIRLSLKKFEPLEDKSFDNILSEDDKDRIELYLNYLRNEQNAIAKGVAESNFGLVDYKDKPKDKGIGTKVVALILNYENKDITAENASKWASKYGYTAKNSGLRLFQDYGEVSTSAKRLKLIQGLDIRKAERVIKRVENAILLLSTDESKKKAEAELKILQEKLEQKEKDKYE